MGVEFIGVGGPGQLSKLTKTDQNTATKSAKSSGSDQVTFSSVLQDVKNTQGTSGDNTRAEKIAEIKAQIADGSYKPDLEKVASSLLQFLVEGK